MTRRTSEKYGVVFTVASDDTCDSQEENCITFRDPNLADTSRTLQGGSESPDSLPSPSHWRESHDFGKNHVKQRETRERCLCCLFCFFLLSTACLTALILLLYTGHFKITDHPILSSSNGQHGSSTLNVSYLGEGLAKTAPQICNSPECIQTAGSVLSRMNLSSDPCTDFYSFSCGGYIKRTRLTWNKTRIREIPDDLPDRYERYLIDMLSSGVHASDRGAVKQLKGIFKSCISRSPRLDESTKHAVHRLVQSLGGIHFNNNSRDSTFDMTSLLANVTRFYGATPFFKVLVHGPGKISLINRYSDHMLELLRSINEDVGSFRFLNPSDFIPRYVQKNKISALQILFRYIVAMLTSSPSEMAVRGAVEEVFHFQQELHKVLYDTDIEWIEDDIRECEIGHRSPIQYLNTNYGDYQINWPEFVSKVMGNVRLNSVTICHIHLSAALQELLSNTPRYILKRYVILHTLLNTNIFSVLPKSRVARRQLDVLRPTFRKSETKEEHCLHSLTELLPNAVICETSQTRFIQAQYTMETLFFNLKQALSETFSGLFGITSEETFKIANDSVSSIAKEWLDVQLLKDSDVQISSDNKHHSYLTSYIRLLRIRSMRYMKGEARHPYNPVITSVFGVLAGCKEIGFPYGGVWFPIPNPSYVHYSSIGSYLARNIADKLDISVLLHHYANDVLNDSAVLYLALKLQCLVDLYNHFEILRQGNTVFKVRGIVTKNENWKDHLALKVAYENWRIDKARQRKEVIIPGLKYSHEQIFFILYAQTMCEKVSKRGLIDYYINDDTQDTPPGKYRVLGSIMNFRPFASSFKCQPNSPMYPKETCHIF